MESSSSTPFPNLAPKKKRNMKGLQLSEASLTAPSSSELPEHEELVPPVLFPKKSSISRKKPVGLDISKSIPTRPAPTPGEYRSASASTSSSRKNSLLNGGGANSNSSTPPSSGGASSGGTKSRQTYHSKLSEQLASLDLSGNGKRVELRTEDLKVVGELGSGNGGTVAKVVHVPSGIFMARKLVLIDAKPSVRKQILRELQIMADCASPYIVGFYGAFMADPHICICMENMDRGSLDTVYRNHGPIDISIVGQISYAVLKGLVYLYDVHHIIHRDIKPSNILVNSDGDVKLCDFGVSGELINSIANTFVGTSTYMSPERIQGAAYTVKSDVWSLGITLIELALGRFPFSESSDSDADDLPPPHRHQDEDLTIHSAQSNSEKAAKKDKRKSKGVSLGGGGMTMSILDLLQHIVNEPAPRLTGFGKDAESFVDWCLVKDPSERKSPGDLLTMPWMTETQAKKINLKTWAEGL